MLNLLGSVCTFCTKICYSNNNYVHNGKEQPHQEFGYGYIFVKNSYVCALPYIEPIYILERRNILDLL